MSLQKPKWLIAMANIFVVIHVIGSYQSPCLTKKMNFKPTKILRFIVRNVYVAFTVLIAITFPFFGGLLGFFGGFAFAPTTYFLPCIMWLSIYKPKRYSLSWWSNYFCIVFGMLLTVLAPIGGLRSIIINCKEYKFYS
ncbi:lysine histidine transporter [Trifolium repens]|nr:lysine histidine transporter [Trifolium repens]